MESCNMQHTEEYYIDRIAKLQAEVDENNQLIESAYEKIEEMKLKLALADSSFTKKGITAKQEQAYKSKIAELEQCVDLFSEDYLNTKADEINSFLKRLINLKSELNKLKEQKRVKQQAIEDIDHAVESLGQDLVIRYFTLTKAIQTLNKSGDISSEKAKSSLTDIISCLDIVREILIAKTSEVDKLKKELERLKKDIIEYTGEYSISELQNKLDAKTREAEAYKDKIAALEFELSKQQKSTKNS